MKVRGVRIEAMRRTIWVEKDGEAHAIRERVRERPWSSAE